MSTIIYRQKSTCKKTLQWLQSNFLPLYFSGISKNKHFACIPVYHHAVLRTGSGYFFFTGSGSSLELFRKNFNNVPGTGTYFLTRKNSFIFKYRYLFFNSHLINVRTNEENIILLFYLRWSRSREPDLRTGSGSDQKVPAPQHWEPIKYLNGFHQSVELRYRYSR